ncbi:putative GNAT family acetyltransferase [Bisporella sp. PMI_857]|nr:putative GNAT family acetyltransferase [Bisporella sp. PMI_857]
MPLSLSLATPDDSPRIAEIHMAAFISNTMLRAQFPTPEIRVALQSSIEKKVLADIKDPQISVLVLEEVDRKIISFSKWNHPATDGTSYEETPWVWPKGTNLEVLEKWTRKTEEAFEKSLKQAPCYRLSFLGTDPAYERRGAASLMIQWGIDQCRKNNFPAYLESTLEASSLYYKHGFVAQERISLHLDRLEGGTVPETYAEVGFVFNP